MLGEERAVRIRNAVAAVSIAAIVIATVPLAGCQRAAEKASEALVENATGVDVDTDENKVTIEGEDGAVEIQSGSELPDGFPSDAPVYDADIDSSGKVSVQGTTSWTVAQTTGDAVEDVLSFFSDELASGGWVENGKTQSEVDGSTIALIGATKGAMQYTVSIQQEEDQEVTIAISVNESE